jgi:hypothetical protein
MVWAMSGSERLQEKGTKRKKKSKKGRKRKSMR